MTIVFAGIQFSITRVNREENEGFAERELQWQALMKELDHRRIAAVQTMNGVVENGE